MSSIFAEFEKGAQIRRTTINWENLLGNIKDGYEQYMGVPHGVQKDAIQNGWDARKSPLGKTWAFAFRLIEGKERTFLIMQDKGTHGLTGQILDEDDYFQDLPKEERWGRFEGLAFTKDEDQDTLGSRGRGKFIFVAASKENTILYDTLLEDGSYRLGARKVEKTRSPIAHREGREARQTLKNITHNRVPRLETVGTRVIIIDPVDELVEDLESGQYLRYIGETWWEIIKKYDAKIGVQVYNQEPEFVELLPEFKLVEEDTDERRYWTVEHKTIEGDIKIKKLHLVHAPPEEVPEDIKGIAVQRGGMKVDSLEPPYLPEDIADGIYGYITVDDDVERELARRENPEHYKFNYRYKVPRAIKNFIELETQRFAKEKLGWKRDERSVRRRRQRSAERKALARMNRLANKYDLDLNSPSPGGQRSSEESSSRKVKMVYIQMPDIVLPTPGYRRVDYEEKVGGIRARAYNDSDDPTQVRIKIYLRRGTEKLVEYYNEVYDLDPHTSTGEIGPFEQTFSESEFNEDGKHTFVARMEESGETIDEQRRSIYLEQEPPADPGLFEDCVPVDFLEENKNLLGQARPGEMGGFVLEYNTSHPEYDTGVDNEEDQMEYLFKLMTLELCRLDLQRGTPVVLQNIDMNDPAEIARGVSEKLGEFSYSFYTEA